MILTSTIQLQLENIERAAPHESQFIQILEAFTSIFPVLNAFLFRYSPLGCIGEGIISFDSKEVVYINERDDIRTLPTIQEAIYERKAKYYSGRELFEKTSSRYIIDTKITSFLIVPISFGSVVTGYIYSTKMVEDTVFDDELLSLLTVFGRDVGRILENTASPRGQTLLSKRELEVMKKIALGNTTKEIGTDLGISEFTVKQYVKLALTKLGALNRTHAVAELFRRGILS